MIACDSYLSLFFFTLQKKLRSGAIVRFSDNSSFKSVEESEAKMTSTLSRPQLFVNTLKTC